MIREAIAHITAGATLSEDEAAAVMEEIMTGVATQAQMGAFLTALRLRPGGETVQEITGLARIMREKAVQVHLDEHVAAPRAGYLRHWRRWRGHVQCLNRRWNPRGCRRGLGRKTRQPFGHQSLWQRRCAGSPGSDASILARNR